MANNNPSARSTELAALNAVLRRCGLRMKSNLEFSPEEDAQYVHDCLIDVFRREQAPGFYLFNRADNQELPIIILNPPEMPEGLLISARATEPWRDEGRRPNVRVEYKTGTGGIRDRIINLSSNDGKFSGRFVHFDLIWYVDFSKAPQVFIDHVVELAALEMAPTFGVTPNMDLVRAAKDRLDRAEYDAIPEGNVYEDNDDSLRLWAREYTPWL